MKIPILYEIEHFVWIIKKRFFKYYIEKCKNFLCIKFNCFIPEYSKIKNNVKFDHPYGIVIGHGVRFGKNCVVYQNVTIGLDTRKHLDSYADNIPKIGDNVTIYAGAVVVGNIVIGNNSVIAANAVVTCDIHDNTMWGGVPAKLIKNFSDKKIDCKENNV